MLGAFFFALAGCQLITGTFNVTSSIGTSCTAVALCCPRLTGSQQSLCASYVEIESEQVCTAFLLTFPNGKCSSTAPQDAGFIIFPDSGAKHDGSVSPTDAKTSGQDVFHGQDGFVAPDAGQDSSAFDPLDGTWSLSDAQCAGESIGVDGTASLDFSGSTVTETDNLSDGCVVTTILSPATITETAITASAGTQSCGTECTTNDNCEPVDTGTVDEPYTLSGGTLTITLPDESGTCSAGTIQYLWTQD